MTLSGELGAGKTAFTKAAARALGVTEDVTSPTFVLMKMYPLTSKSFSTLVHIDVDFTGSEAGQSSCRFIRRAFSRSRGTYVMLEWPERVADALRPRPQHSPSLPLQTVPAPFLCLKHP